MSGFVTLKDVKKIYQMGEVKIMAADGIDFEIQKGEFAVVVGPSGAGKTTVLNILGGMDTATEGQVLVDGTDIAKYSQKQLTAYRRDDIGFVFQFYNLIPNLTALENVELALQICKGCQRGAGRCRAWGSSGEFPGAVIRRGTAESVHCKGTCQEPEASLV